jgi:hypothetical protein
MRCLLALLVPLLLSACGPPAAWVRPGSNLVQVEQDQRECAQLAARQARTEYWWDDSIYSGPPIQGRERDWFARQQQAELDYELHRHGLQDACMRARGYQLEAISPRGG